jgi:hypothetical protein
MAQWYIQPDKEKLDEFLVKFRRKLVIPSIQRQFVWDHENVKRLVDSIINGYPIGSLILWETGTHYPCAPLQGEILPTGDRYYIIDGQQRLTALLLMKNDWKLQRGKRTISTLPICYNQDNKQLYVGSTKGIDVSRLLRAASGGVLGVKQLEAEHPGAETAVAEVAERILNYQIPYYIIRSTEPTVADEYRGIAEMFVRINSEGVTVGNIEMFLSFFSAAFSGNHRDRIIELYEDLQDACDLDLGTFLRFLFSRLELKQTQITKVEQFNGAISGLSKRFDDATVSTVIERSGAALKTLVAGVQERFGKHIAKFMPSELMLLPLAHYCYLLDGSPTDADWKDMLKWLLIGSFEGYLSARTNSRLEKDFKVIATANGSFPLQALLDRMQSEINTREIQRRWILDEYAKYDAYKALDYKMMLYVLLTSANATDWDGNALRATPNEIAVHHIFPQELLRESYEREEINSVANLTIISAPKNASLLDSPPDEYLDEFDPIVLEQHCIPRDPVLWKLERYPDFLAERATLLWSRVGTVV